jgi:hypothetical protein
MLAAKPLSDFFELDKCFSAAAEINLLKPHERLILNDDQPKVTVVLQGDIKLDRSEGNILVTICAAPVIIGLPGVLRTSSVRYVMTAVTPCEFYQLDTVQCAKLLEQHQLWHAAFNWLSWKCRMQEQRDIQLIGKSSYSQIRATLQSMEKWDQTLRARIGVMNYIHQCTHISRSVIAEVLSALREGHYIEMEKGKLVTIHRLPLEY